ncbi:MAG: DUF3108 domain-containing protein [Pseudomonadales bacterium]|nr:DUF3108 domain-containing protein [Pseudomonadales bacterium]
MPCRALFLLVTLAAFLGLAPLSFADDHSGSYRYDAKMAFLKAGELRLNLEREGESYQVEGQFKTSRALSPYYTWNGVFAAVGRWSPFGGPVTTAYMSQTTGKDHDLKIVLTYPDATRVLEGAEDEFESIDRPGGIDLISALFFSPSCYQGGLVHDGEDSYTLSLNSERNHGFNGGRKYFKGEVTSCDYRVIDHKQRQRRVIVSMAELGGTKVAVQVRAKIPLLPDAVFRLRMPELGNQPASAR